MTRRQLEPKCLHHLQHVWTDHDAGTYENMKAFDPIDRDGVAFGWPRSSDTTATIPGSPYL